MNDVTPNELHLMRKLTIGEEAVRLAGLEPNSDRTRYLASLHKKLASGHRTQAELVREAELAMAAGREDVRQQLLSGPSHDAGPTFQAPAAGKKTFDLLASKAAQADGANRVRQEAAVWRAQAAARERRRQAMVRAAENADGGEVGAHSRGLRSLIKSNGGFG